MDMIKSEKNIILKMFSITFLTYNMPVDGIKSYIKNTRCYSSIQKKKKRKT